MLVFFQMLQYYNNASPEKVVGGCASQMIIKSRFDNIC